MNTRGTGGPSRIGVAMIAVAWLLLLGLLTAWFNGLLNERENPNGDVQGRVLAGGVRQVVLQQNRRGHYVARGAINGRSVTLLVDTGATTVSVPGDLARDLALPAGPAGRTRTANGVIVTYATRLRSVRLGNIVLEDVPANINPGMQGDEVLLGMSALRRLEFTQRGDSLTLRQRPAGS